MRPCYADCKHVDLSNRLSEANNLLHLRITRLENALGEERAKNGRLLVIMHRVDAINGEIVARQAREIAELRHAVTTLQERLRQVDTIATRKPWAVVDPVLLMGWAG